MVSLGVGNFEFQVLLDTGAAVTAVSARIWGDHFIDIYPNVNLSACSAVTTVDGCALLSQVGKTRAGFSY